MEDQGPTFAFLHTAKDLNREVSVLSTIYDGGIVVGFSDNSIRIYQHQLIAEDQKGEFELIAHVKNIRKEGSSIVFMETCDYKTWQGSVEDALIVGYSDGLLCQFNLPAGKLLNCKHLPFACRGVDTTFDIQSLLIWGYACELIVIDRTSLETRAIWSNLPEWPLPIPLFDNKVLLVFKSGQTSQWKIRRGEGTYYSAEPQDDPELDLFFTQHASVNNNHNSNSGGLHLTDIVVGVRRVGTISWLVVQRNGWTLFKWEDESLVKQISSLSEQPLIDAIVATNPTDRQECFGILNSNGSVIWVYDGSVQLIEPVWDSSVSNVIKVMYDLSKDLLLAHVNTPNGVEIFIANRKVSPVSWDKGSIKLEGYSVKKNDLFSIHCENIVHGYGSNLCVYDMTSYLTQFGQIEASLSLEDKEFTAFEESSGYPDIFAGSSDGALLAIDARNYTIKFNTQVFATPVSVIRRFAKGFGKYSEYLVVLSKNSTVAIVDPASGQMKSLLPGNNVSVVQLRAMMRQTNDGPTECGVCINYENGEQRSWDFDQDREISKEDFHSFTISELAGHDYSSYYLTPLASPGKVLVSFQLGKFIDDLVEEPQNPELYDDKTLHLIKSLLGNFLRVDKKKITSKWQELFVDDEVVNSDLRIGEVSFDNSIVSVSLKNPNFAFTGVDNVSAATLTAIWIILARILLKSVGKAALPTTGKMLKWLMESMPSHNFNASGFARLATLITTGSVQIRQSARACLKELIRAAEKNELEAYEIVAYWMPLLPSMTAHNMFDRPSLEALEILANLCILRQQQQSVNNSQQQSSNSSINRQLCREVAESLQLYLTAESPETNRNVAIEFIGKGWSLWQKHFNPISTLDAIIAVLYTRGYISKDKSTQTSQSIIELCRRCIQNIAVQNVTLLISILVMQVNAGDKNLDSRVTCVRLLSNLLESYITPLHLTTIISAIVKLLDPSIPSLRQLAEIGKTSLTTEATQFLAAAISKYPDYLAFHKEQQRLAISTVAEIESEESAIVVRPRTDSISLVGITPVLDVEELARQQEQKKPVSMTLLGLVYDLRTGTVIGSLGVHSHMEVTPGSTLSKLRFSPDGKHLGAVLIPPENIHSHYHVTLACWKLGFGFMSLFQSFTNISASDDASASDDSKKGTSVAAIYPKMIKRVPSHYENTFDLNWDNDATLRVKGDLDPDPIKVQI